MSKTLTLFLVFILLCLCRNAGAQITGSVSVCAGSTWIYHAPVVAGAAYSWTLTGGNISGAANSDSLVVQWSVAGPGAISVAVTDPSNVTTIYNLSVTVHPLPAPVISHIPYPGCPRDTGRNGTSGQGPSDCEKVCKKATIVYSTPLHAGSTYLWTVAGAAAAAGLNTNTITVTWDTASAYGYLTVYETNQWGCTDSTTLCVEKVNLPVAGFTSQSSACRYSTVQFTNLSGGAATYQWYFGDGGSSSLVSPSHAYAISGTYTITLIAENSCHCMDTFRGQIHIDSAAGPAITCPSTVCAFATASYSVPPGSGCVYHWFAIGGTITAGQGTPGVTVQWGAGQLGTLGLYVTGCSGTCSDTTRIYIPIVPAVAVISGPNRVCAGDCAEYTLPEFSGATYTWSLNGSYCGVKEDSSCCGHVKICWPSYLFSCQDTLVVSYYDSFLNCGGTGSLIIHLQPKLSISGNLKACANDNTAYNAFGGINCNWFVSPAGPALSPANPAPAVTVSWNNLPGTYTVTAVPFNPLQVCNDSAVISVNVSAPPPAPLISGDTNVCPNSAVSYCGIAPYPVHWLITNGTPVSTTGNCVTVQWGGSGPYYVGAYQSMPNSPFCNSDTTVQQVHPIIAGIPALTGPLTACANSTYTFATSTVYPPGATYMWTISPANAGAILSPSSPSTQIQWGNNAPQTVTVTLTVNVCNSSVQNTISVSLMPAPTPSVTQTGSLCAGGSALLNATGGPYAGYSWSGPALYTSAVNPTTILLNGLYQVTVTDANGCTAHTQKNVSYVSGPVASISTPEPLSYCIGGPAYIVNMCALGNANYSYQWSTLATSQCINVSGQGSYMVTVTDFTTGCTAVSNTLVVVEDSCHGGGPGPCSPLGSISFTHSGCNPVSFTNTSVSGSGFSWDFGDLTGSFATSPVHPYVQAGFYLVTLTGSVPNAAGGPPCVLSDTAHIEIPLAAKFDMTSGCNGDSVCFTDRSTFTAGNNITSWSWNFGDTYTSPLQNPCHLYAAPGSYIVVLTISNGTCSTTSQDTVVVPNPPTAAFTSSHPNCINQPVSFTDGSFTGINYWAWDFGDAGTSLIQNPSHNYTLANIYPVTLIVQDIYGCRDTAVNPVTIAAPTLTGSIVAFPDTIICSGASVLLVAPPCLTCTYLWSTGAANDSVAVLTTGIYSVTITDTNGCPYTAFIHVIVNNGPPAVITNDGSDDLCLGDSRNLSVSSNVNWLYYWITNDVPNNGAVTSSIYISPAPAGTYTYRVVVSDTVTGCIDTSMTYIIRVHPNPVPPAIASIGPGVICQGDTVTLVGSHPDSTVTFEWNDGEVTDTIKVTENSCYQLQVTDTNGCKNTASYCVTVNPLPDLCGFYTGCLDTCTAYTIHGPPNGATYQWLLNGVPIAGATAQNYAAAANGAYSVIVTNTYGCTDTTGLLDLTMHDCHDTMCSQLIIDSTGCDSSGVYIMHYHVVNTSSTDLAQVNLEILRPNLNVPYAPNVNFVAVPAGGASPALTAMIYNVQEGDTLCFRSHVSNYDSLGHEILCCYSDTSCTILPPCQHTPPDTNCCYFHFLSDSVWCSRTPAGTVYNFSFRINGCGHLNIQSSNAGVLNVNNPYLLTAGVNIVTGSYVATGTDSVLCLRFTVSHDTVHCADTVICFLLQCSVNPLPCHWDYNQQVCQGSSTTFGYYGNPAGLTITWSFTGGVPATANGPGPFSVTYPNPGVYPFTMTLTNSGGSTICSDSITVVAKPVASITQSGSTLNAYPAGMSYQWYTGPNLVVINGATNQFYTPAHSGYYCVSVTNNQGCGDSACTNYFSDGIENMESDSWGIYPNPNDGSFTLSIDLGMSENTEMKVINILGDVIDMRVFDLTAGSHKLYIANKSFSAGVYYVRIKTETWTSERKMVVK